MSALLFCLSEIEDPARRCQTPADLAALLPDKADGYDDVLDALYWALAASPAAFPSGWGYCLGEGFQARLECIIKRILVRQKGIRVKIQYADGMTGSEKYLYLNEEGERKPFVRSGEEDRIYLDDSPPYAYYLADPCDKRFYKMVRHDDPMFLEYIRRGLAFKNLDAAILKAKNMSGF